MVTDPFESLTKSTQTYELYISGRLTVLAVPSGLCGEWTRHSFPSLPHHDSWHRRLTADAFLWLRSAVRKAIESGNLSSEFKDATQRLEHIAELGITHGCFTADEIAEHCRAPEWFSFNSGLPAWADEITMDYLPPTRRAWA